MEWRKRKKLIYGFAVLLVLVFSFWYGGDSDGLQGFSVTEINESETEYRQEKTSEESRTQETHSETITEESAKDSGNTFTQIVMNIRQKKSAESSEKNTQNNKKAQQNANKAAKKAVKSSKKAKQSLGIQEEHAETVENADRAEQGGTKDKSRQDMASGDGQLSDEEQNRITCTIEISCKVLSDNPDKVRSEKRGLLPIPKDGMILEETTVQIEKGSTVFDVLQTATRANHIHLEYNFTPFYKSYYIEGINNIYEFDAGDLSGWMYSVNGEFPGYGCSEYEVENGDIIRWLYTCNLGKDVGGYFEE